MPGHGEKLERRWEQTIAALLSQSTIAGAAKQAGVDVTTLYRWLKDQDFYYAFYKARNDLLQHALGHIAEGLVAAATVLREILVDPDASATAKVSAAKALFDLAQKDKEQASLEARVAALEEALKAQEAMRAA